MRKTNPLDKHFEELPEYNKYHEEVEIHNILRDSFHYIMNLAVLITIIICSVNIFLGIFGGSQ